MGINHLTSLEENCFALYSNGNLQTLSVQEGKATVLLSLAFPEVESIFYLKST